MDSDNTRFLIVDNLLIIGQEEQFQKRKMPRLPTAGKVLPLSRVPEEGVLFEGVFNSNWDVVRVAPAANQHSTHPLLTPLVVPYLQRHAIHTLCRAWTRAHAVKIINDAKEEIARLRLAQHDPPFWLYWLGNQNKLRRKRPRPLDVPPFPVEGCNALDDSSYYCDAVLATNARSARRSLGAYDDGDPNAGDLRLILRDH